MHDDALSYCELSRGGLKNSYKQIIRNSINLQKQFLLGSQTPEKLLIFTEEEGNDTRLKRFRDNKIFMVLQKHWQSEEFAHIIDNYNQFIHFRKPLV